MTPIITVTDNPPRDAFERLWSALLEFNEAEAGSADSVPIAVLLSSEADSAMELYHCPDHIIQIFSYLLAVHDHS